jgi:hypothetical protein
MLTKPSTAALTGLAQLMETPRGRDVDEMMTTEIEAVTNRLIGARIDADAHELRGRLATLRDLRQIMLNARDLLRQQGQSVPLP